VIKYNSSQKNLKFERFYLSGASQTPPIWPTPLARRWQARLVLAPAVDVVYKRQDARTSIKHQGRQRACSGATAAISTWPIAPTIGKCDVIHKTGSTYRIATPLAEDQTTAACVENSVKVGTWTCGSGDMLADKRQTYRLTDTSCNAPLPCWAEQSNDVSVGLRISLL